MESFFSGGGLTSGNHGTPITRMYERRRLDSGANGAVLNWLTPRAAGPGLDLFIIQLEPGAEMEGASAAKQGVETGLVLEGGMEFELKDQIYLLGAGDTFTFPSHKDYRIRNAGPRQTTIAWARNRSDAPPERAPPPPEDDPEHVMTIKKGKPDDTAMDH